MKTKIAVAAAMAALLMTGAAALAADKGPNPEAGAAKPAKPGRDQCFWANNVDGFAAVDEHTVNVRVGMHDVYQFEMMGHCPDLDWTHKIALVSRGAGSFICSGLDAELVVPSSTIGPQRCPVDKIHKLSPAEIAALPKKARP
jgi:hypothetical protein